MHTTTATHTLLSRAFWPGLLAMLWTTISLTSTAQAQTGLVAKLGVADRAELAIGDDLWVDWPDAPLDATLDVHLVDAAGRIVASRLVDTGSKGWSEPLLLWPVTGVVGCDADTLEGFFRYATFEEALHDLLGDDLRVEIVGQPVSFGIRMTRPTEVIYYFSDLFGCPRSSFARSETQYLSAWAAHGGDIPTELTLFLGRDDCPKHVDVRSRPQAFAIPPASRQATREIGTSCDLGCGQFTGWVRPTHDVSCVDLEGDACGLSRCVDTKSDVAVYAIGPEALARNIQTKGHTNADWDDGQCDLCDDADQGGGD